MDSAAAQVYLDQDTFTTCLLTLVLDRYGPELMSWAPQTIVDEIEADTGVELPTRNLDRLMGGIVLLTRPDEYYGSAAGFTDITSAIAGEWFEPNVWHPPTTEECLWSVVESYLLDPPEDNEHPRFSNEVTRYVNRIVREDGYPQLPQEFISFGLNVDRSLPDLETYDDDPQLAQIALAGQQGRADDIRDWLAGHFWELAHRIANLPITSAHQDEVINALLSAAAKSKL